MIGLWSWSGRRELILAGELYPVPHSTWSFLYAAATGLWGQLGKPCPSALCAAAPGNPAQPLQAAAVCLSSSFGTTAALPCGVALRSCMQADPSLGRL